MTLDERLSLARDLIARRDAIDAELTALFRGGTQVRKAFRKCKNCGEPGHRSDACPSLRRQMPEDDPRIERSDLSSVS